jgi:hypothetical protein
MLGWWGKEQFFLENEFSLFLTPNTVKSSHFKDDLMLRVPNTRMVPPILLLPPGLGLRWPGLLDHLASLLIGFFLSPFQ